MSVSGFRCGFREALQPAEVAILAVLTLRIEGLEFGGSSLVETYEALSIVAISLQIVPTPTVAIVGLKP